MTPRLGINIDHVATLRQARGEEYPSTVEAANVCLNSGADQITIHLREDRRHIQDIDVEAIRLVTKKFGKPLNLEMGCAREIIDIACTTAPDWVCLVPEKREELTTEGGLNISDDCIFEQVQTTCKILKDKIENVKISLFLEASEKIIKRACELRPDAVEIHTGQFALLFGNQDNHHKYLNDFKTASALLKSSQIACHAGHGINSDNLLPLLELKIFEEYNIGHWVVCQSIFEGIPSVIKRLKSTIKQYPI